MANMGQIKQNAIGCTKGKVESRNYAPTLIKFDKTHFDSKIF